MVALMLLPTRAAVCGELLSLSLDTGLLCSVVVPQCGPVPMHGA
jgi:hypothetical protein